MITTRIGQAYIREGVGLLGQAGAAEQLLEPGIASRETEFLRRFRGQCMGIASSGKETLQLLDHFPIIDGIPAHKRDRIRVAARHRAP
jgi:hypothetical protein